MVANANTSKGVNLEGRVFRKLGETADEFEVYAHPHAERIATIATEIARKFSLASKDLQSLRAAALLHDFGESIMNRDYIKRAGLLSADERLDLYRHPLIGEQETANSGGDRAAQLIVRWHHEWWNGTGYPDGLSREEIPLACRILRVADSYAAITDHRPFRRAMNKEQAREHMAEWAGIEFDPNVVETLLALEPIPELDSFAESEILFEEPIQTQQDNTVFSSSLR
jgi:HD-GYP domain-containing protein (c-di-GMP phosphodiesterase class II)